MDDDFAAFIGGFVFWTIINLVIGYLIGSRKNMAGLCMFLCWLLGPIGWLISALLEGGKKCPACKETIKQDAIICRHCGLSLRARVYGPGEQGQSTYKQY
jgi:hypothetical protein